VEKRTEGWFVNDQPSQQVSREERGMSETAIHERFSEAEIEHLRWLRVASDPDMGRARDNAQTRKARCWAMEIEISEMQARAAITKAAALNTTFTIGETK
jgi:hypothetical protein